MGVTGSLVITRVMGLLLGAIAVNFVSIGMEYIPVHGLVMILAGLQVLLRIRTFEY